MNDCAADTKSVAERGGFSLAYRQETLAFVERDAHRIYAQ